MEDLMKNKLQKMIKDKIEKHWIAEYQGRVTQEEGMGILVSQYFDWDGLCILKTLSTALEDANFHRENEVIRKMIKNIESEVA